MRALSRFAVLSRAVDTNIIKGWLWDVEKTDAKITVLKYKQMCARYFRFRAFFTIQMGFSIRICLLTFYTSYLLNR